MTILSLIALTGGPISGGPSGPVRELAPNAGLGTARSASASPPRRS